MANAGNALGGAGTGATIGTALGGPGVGTAIGAGVGALAGYFTGSDNSDQISEVERQAMEAMKNLDIPTLQALTPILTHYREAGLLSPEMEATISAPDSLMGKVMADPRLKDAQMGALNKMTQQSQGGLNMADKAALDSIMRKTANQEHGSEQAILQDMQQKGQAGSGSELAARLSASQNAGNQAASNGLQVGATATQRALEALSKSGDMATSMRSQDFGEQSQKAQAQDVINKFNAQNSQAVMARNVAASNNAQAANLANKQAVMNANTGVDNEAAYARAGAAQQDYQNRASKATGIMKGSSEYAKQLQTNQDRTNETVGKGISAVGGAATALGNTDWWKKLHSGDGTEGTGGTSSGGIGSVPGQTTANSG